MTRDGVVKILDFGLARVAPRETSASELARAPTVEELTGEGAVLGTVGYMSPEQVRGEPADARSDLFSLGCVLVELLTGRRAFAGESAVDTMHAILHAEPPGVDDLAGVSPALADVVHRCLEKRSDRRFQTAADLAFALEHVESTAGTAPARLAKPRTRPSRAVLAAAGLVTVAVAIAGFLVLRNRPISGSDSKLPTFNRIAVLPFEIPPEARDELAPIADGLAQALINELSRLPDLRVTPWMTARRYATTDLTPAKLSEELGVEALLAISMRPESRTVVADLALLEQRSGFQVWGERVSVPAADPVALRSAIVKTAALALRPRLDSNLATTVARPISSSAEAYELALTASALVDSWNRAVIDRADGLIRRAMALDPDLALAKRARGELEYVRYYLGWGGDQRNLELARQFLELAIASDPEDSRAYDSLISVYWMFGQEEEALALVAPLFRGEAVSAERLLVAAEAYRLANLHDAAGRLAERAQLLDPADDRAKGIRALCARCSGRYAEAVELNEELFAKHGELDARTRFRLASARWAMNDLSGAERDYRRALELGPDDILIYLALGNLLASQDRAPEARSIWREGLERTSALLASEPQSDRLHGFAIRLHAALGDRLAVEREELWSARSTRKIRQLPLFTARVLLGDEDQAIDFAFGALAQGQLWVGEALGCNVTPGSAIDRLSRHPRYAALVAEWRRVQADLLARYPID